MSDDLWPVAAARALAIEMPASYDDSDGRSAPFRADDRARCRPVSASQKETGRQMQETDRLMRVGRENHQLRDLPSTHVQPSVFIEAVESARSTNGARYREARK